MRPPWTSKVPHTQNEVRRRPTTIVSVRSVSTTGPSAATRWFSAPNPLARSTRSESTRRVAGRPRAGGSETFS
jgi:hypothetical protein